MPRTLTETIEDESAKERLRVIDLLKVTFPQPIGTVFWANTFCEYQNVPYTPRIISVGSWKRTLNPETDDIEIVLSNADGELTYIYNNVTMELAEVSLIRYYPDLNEAIDPLWKGWGGTITLDEETATWSVNFGLRGMTQRGLRTLASNCWKLFADGKYCPYDPLGTGIGGCSTLNADIADASTTNMTVADTDYYHKGDVVQIDDEQIRIFSVGIPMSIERGYNNTTATTHTSGTSVVHVSCTKDKDSCDRRRMYGPPTESDGFRFFGGWIPAELTSISIPEEPYNIVAEVAYSTVGEILANLFGTLPYGTVQDVPYNRVLPVGYGYVRIKDVPSVLSYDAREFVHSFHIIGEGAVSAVGSSSIKVGSIGIDTNLYGHDSDGQPYRQGAVIFFGGIGQRASYGAVSQQWIDYYHNNPYLFNDDNGEGCNVSDLFCIYTRIEEENDAARGEWFETNSLEMDLQFIGRAVRTVQGWIDDDDTKATIYPNPIEVALDYCLNGKFGPRLDKKDIDLDQALIESAYCDEQVTSVDPDDEEASVDRFNFNGVIDDDKSAEEHLARILENCNGYYIQNNGKIQFGIRRAVDLNDVVAEKPLIDYGTDRNILRENGKSTVIAKETGALDGYVNNITVSFKDLKYGLENNKVLVYDDVRQQLAAQIINTDATRTVNNDDLDLNGTITLDQASRLGALRIREEYMKRDEYTFQMSLKDSVKLAPGDVRLFCTFATDEDNDRRLSGRTTYVRIWEIEETDKFTATITAARHDNSLYDDGV